MKKILVLFALLMTGVMGIHAQEGLKWGAMAGMNSSKFSTDGFDSKVGFHVGIKAEKDLPQIAQGVYLDMAALLSLKGTQINGNDASLKFNPYYLEIPIHMGYKYAINDNFAIFGNFGPYFAVGLFGKMKATGYLIDEVEGLTSIHDSAKVFGSNAMKRFDFGLGLKAGVEFFQKYQVSIGYDWGLLDNIEDSGNKNRNLMLSVGDLTNQCHPHFLLLAVLFEMRQNHLFHPHHLPQKECVIIFLENLLFSEFLLCHPE